MSEFTTAATLEVEIDDNSLRSARNRIERDLNDVRANGGAGSRGGGRGRRSPMSGGGGMASLRDTARDQLDTQQVLVELAEERNELLEDLGRGNSGDGGGRLPRGFGGGGGGLGGILGGVLGIGLLGLGALTLNLPDASDVPDLNLPSPSDIPELNLPDASDVPELNVPDSSDIPRLRAPEAVPELTLSDGALAALGAGAGLFAGSASGSGGVSGALARALGSGGSFLNATSKGVGGTLSGLAAVPTIAGKQAEKTIQRATGVDVFPDPQDLVEDDGNNTRSDDGFSGTASVTVNPTVNIDATGRDPRDIEREVERRLDEFERDLRDGVSGGPGGTLP
jgi:hypothetical protein